MNIQSIPNHHLPVLHLFRDNYERLRQNMDAPCLDSLLALAPFVFGKWYHAALLPDTILSPANLFALDFPQARETNTEYAYVLKTDSSAAEDKAEAYRFSLLSYSTKEHPLLRDLQTLLGYFVPDRATDAAGLLSAADTAALTAKLSLSIPFYTEYLMRLAWRQGLLVPMPSIHTQRAQPSQECAAFFAQSTKEILLQLGESACALAAERFAESMDLDENIQISDFFRSLLTRSQDLDQVFVSFYQKWDVDSEAIWPCEPEKLNEEQRSIVSSFLYTGILLDKWFLTPMSLFFRFLRPIGFRPMQFHSVLNTLSSLLLTGQPTDAELFAPPSYYSLTPLGKALFAPAATEDKQLIPPDTPFAQLAAVVFEQARRQRQEEERFFAAGATPDILSVRVRYTQEEEYWRILEVSQDMEIHAFCLELCAAFAFYVDAQPDYLLSLPDENGFPIAYSAAGSKRSLNKTNGKPLRKLPLPVGSRLTLYPDYTKGLSLTLEILEQRKGSPYLLYPRITGQSEKFAQLEQQNQVF